MVGLDDLRGLFQPQCFYDPMILPASKKAALTCVTPYVNIDTEAIQLSCPAMVYSIPILI